MVAMQMVFQIILLLCSIYAMSEQAAGLAISSSCEAKSSCGNVSNIPYPFGIGAGCYVDDWFEVVCNDSFSPPKPFLRSLNLEVLNISIEGGTVRVNYPTFSSCTGGDQISKPNLEFPKRLILHFSLIIIQTVNFLLFKQSIFYSNSQFYLKSNKKC